MAVPTIARCRGIVRNRREHSSIADAGRAAREARSLHDQVSAMKWAAIEAHRICWEASLAHPEIATLQDEGRLHRAIHAIVAIDTPGASAMPPRKEGAD